MLNCGEKIKRIRLAQNMSQVELARRLNVAPANVCRLEQGQNDPSLRTLERVAEALGISVGTLLSEDDSEKGVVGTTNTSVRPEPVELLELVEGASWADLSTSTRTAVLKREREYARLEAELGIPSATSVHLVHPLDVTHGGAESVARYVRSSCDAGTSTLADLSSLLEFRNVRIHFTQLPSQVQSIPFFNSVQRTFSILLQANDTPERHTYRLAYELGTAALFASRGYVFQTDRELVHRFARDFAAAFLMPAEAVRAAVAQTGLTASRWSLASLLALKTRFNVSAEAFALRLEELDLISQRLRHQFRDQLRAYYKAHPDAMEPSPCLKPLVRYSRLEIMREAAVAIGKEST